MSGGRVQGFPCMPVIVTSGIPSFLQAPSQMVQRREEVLGLGLRGGRGVKAAFVLMWFRFPRSVHGKKAGIRKLTSAFPRHEDKHGELTDGTWASSIRII